MRKNFSVGVLICLAIYLAASSSFADTVKLKNGETHIGEITRETEETIVLLTRDTGARTFNRSDISEIIRGDDKNPQETEKAKPGEKPVTEEKPAAAGKTESSEPNLDVITMKNGIIHKGNITHENDEFITIRMLNSGFKVLRKEDAESIKRARKEEKKDDQKKKGAAPLPAGSVTDILKKLTNKEPISEKEAVKQIVKLGAEALPALIRLLRSDPGKAELSVTAEAVAQLHDDNTVSEVRSLLSSESRNTQLNALTVLGKIGDPESVGALLECMLGEDQEMSAAADKAVAATLRRESANHLVFMKVHDAARSAKKNGKTRIARVLGGSGSRLALPPLLTLVNDWDTSVKVTAVISIGKLGFDEPAACTEVRRLLKSEDTQVKREAALALGRLQDIDSVDSLITLLQNDNRGIRKNAYWALKNITGLRFPDNYTRWKVWWDSESGKYRKKREALLNVLRTGTNDERLKAIDKLTAIRFGSKQITTALLSQITSGDKRIRIKACEALGSIGARDAVPDLVKQLDDIEQSVQKAAHSALKAITGQNLPQDMKEWEKWLRSSNW